MLWLVYIGALTTFKDVIPRGIGAAVAVAWTGVIVFHGILTNMTQERDQAIEGEVERLRQALYEEKPKRLDLDEDGELRDVIDDDAASSQQANY